mgnify:FL=1
MSKEVLMKDLSDMINDAYLDVIKWRTKEGEILYLFQMRDSHLRNCIKFLERNLEKSDNKVDINFYIDAMKYELSKR